MSVIRELYVKTNLELRKKKKKKRLTILITSEFIRL